MYESHWGLDCRPFESREPQRFHFASAEQRTTELKLRYVLDRPGAALLSGGPGVGKTHLLRMLAQGDAAADREFIELAFPQMPTDQLLAFVAARCSGQPLVARAPAAESLQTIEEQLAASDRGTVLLVDEAHLLPRPTLETLRLLLNLGAGGRGLTVVLCGQTPLRRRIEQLPEWEERLDAKCHLGRLDAAGTAGYVRHRLAAACAARPLFSAEALDELHRRSQGVPGRINRIADMALLVGFGEETSLITPRHIAAVDRDLFASPWAA